MSDLISRSDVIQILKECNLDETLFEKDVFDKINNLPTAYDVDNVIKMLNTLKNEYKERRKNTYCRITETDSCDSCRADHYLDARIGAVDRSIEIVKRGGLSDDVCEWKIFDNSLTEEPQWVYETTCGGCIGEEHTSKAFVYCPYCSKKIKVVE